MADADSGSPVRKTAPHRARRTRGQKAAIFSASLVTMLCFLVAGGLALGQHLVEQRQIADFHNPADAAA